MPAHCIIHEQWLLAAAVKEMESKVEDTSTFSALPQEEQQELEQTLSQNSKAFVDFALRFVVPTNASWLPSLPVSASSK